MYTADVWRVQGRLLAEHWDVVEDPEGMLRRLPAP
jgi:predicted SnoaL-like aldol condensation-catalyzing enzyme